MFLVKSILSISRLWPVSTIPLLSVFCCCGCCISLLRFCIPSSAPRTSFSQSRGSFNLWARISPPTVPKTWHLRLKNTVLKMVPKTLVTKLPMFYVGNNCYRFNQHPHTTPLDLIIAIPTRVLVISWTQHMCSCLMVFVLHWPSKFP